MMVFSASPGNAITDNTLLPKVPMVVILNRVKKNLLLTRLYHKAFQLTNENLSRLVAEST